MHKIDDRTDTREHNELSRALAENSDSRFWDSNGSEAKTDLFVQNIVE